MTDFSPRFHPPVDHAAAPSARPGGLPDPPPRPEPHVIRIGHSPDPDDAFMWWPLADFADGSGPGGLSYTPQVDTEGFHFVHILEDIQTLNERAELGQLEVTAISIAQYPYVADRYALTSCGASMGDGYGPMIVTPKDKPVDLDRLARDPEAARAWRLAIPGLRTSAWLSLRLAMREMGFPAEGPAAEVVPFDRIIPAVQAGDFDAGLIIHEGQLTYAEAGLECALDLGRWWLDTRAAPLPLGGNCIRRDLNDELNDPDAVGRLCRVLLRSIEHALDHREQAIDYALHYARDMGPELADRFVGMYVNDRTIDYGLAGREAVQRLLGDAAAAGLCPDVGAVDFITPK